MARKPVSYLAGSMLLGTAIGAIVGLLAAPKSGLELRKTLRQRAEDARQRVGEAGKALPGRVSALPGKGMERIGKLRIGKMQKVWRGRGQDETDGPAAAGEPGTRVTVEGDHAGDGAGTP